MLIRLNNNNEFFCDNCGSIYKGYMYIIDSVKIKSVYLLLCKQCLFKLALELNNMFEINSLLDGTDYNVVKSIYNDMGIPKDVYEAICEGRIIQAIKAYREHIGYYTDPTTGGKRLCKVTLIEARDKIKYWQELIGKQKGRTIN